MTDARPTINALRAATVEFDLVAAEFAKTQRLNATDLRALIGLLDRERAGEPATPGWLGAHLAINSASVTALVDRLVERGLVERVRDASDRRRVLLQASDTAKDLGEDFFRPVFGRIGAVAADYSADEMSTVQRFLADVVSALRGEDRV